MMANMPVFQEIMLPGALLNHLQDDVFQSLRCGKPTARKAELEKAKDVHARLMGTCKL